MTTKLSKKVDIFRKNALIKKILITFGSQLCRVVGLSPIEVKLQFRVLLGAIFKIAKERGAEHERSSEIGMLAWYHHWRIYRQLAQKYPQLQFNQKFYRWYF